MEQGLPARPDESGQGGTVWSMGCDTNGAAKEMVGIARLILAKFFGCEFDLRRLAGL